MKIAVVGCGALGSYYGARLCQAGHATHFLLRSDFEVVRQRGVTIEGAEGDFHVHPHCAREPEEIGPCDLVIIGLKSTANHILPRVLPPLAGPGTAFLTLQNGLGNEAEVAAVVGAEKTLGGLCFVCLNRLEPGRICHLAHGAIVMGEYLRPAQERTRAISKAIRHSGVKCTMTDNLEQAHWEKLVWNIPFNGLGVASAAEVEAVRRGSIVASGARLPCLTTDALLADPAWTGLVRELMMETIRAARAQGYDLPDTAADWQIARTREMGPYKASTLIDFERGQAIELESLFRRPLLQAQAAGMDCPRLAALCSVLETLTRFSGV